MFPAERGDMLEQRAILPKLLPAQLWRRISRQCPRHTSAVKLGCLFAKPSSSCDYGAHRSVWKGTIYLSIRKEHPNNPEN